MSRSIIVLPDDTAKPILEAINQAKKSIRVKMFLFSDPGLLDAVIGAQHRGVDVRIMLNPERRDGEKENADTRKKLTDAGVHVSDSNPAFDVTHEKSMVIDDAIAFVQSLNWETKNVTETQASTASEDFSKFAQKVPGLFVFLGVTSPTKDWRTVAVNHSPLFEADEAALPVGVRVMAGLAVDFLSGTPTVSGKSN